MLNPPSLALLRVNIYVAVAAGAVPFIDSGLAFAQVDINMFSLYGLARVLDYEVGGGEACRGGIAVFEDECSGLAGRDEG